jgi:thiol-disulfide isomerase/thioredoxin
MSADNLYDYERDKVRELTPDQLTKKGDLPIVKDGQINASIYFIIFYAPWCGHCKNMKDDVSNLAIAMSENDLHDIFCAVNCEKHNKELTEKDIDIQGYPTINFVMDGKSELYEGPRNPEGLLTKITKSIEEKLGVDANSESDKEQ